MYEAVGIGVSSGGLAALLQIIPKLRADLPLPVIVVQHRLPEHDDFLQNFLNEKSQLSVKEAESGEQLKSRYVYIAPPGYHLYVERDKSFSLSVDPPVNYTIPSVDVLFDSAASAYGSSLIGIVLTGANSDGSLGLQTIKQHGGLTIVQDPLTAEMPVMPQSAIDLVDIDHIIPLDKIAGFLNELSYEVQDG